MMLRTRLRAFTSSGSKKSFCIFNNLPYDLICFLIHSCFLFLAITTTTTVDDSVSITRTRLVNQARPFEEVLVGQPTSDVLTKPGDGGS